MTRCLIVDDEEQSRYFLEVLLRGNGFETLTADHGAEALEKARAHPPGLIISDIMMPVMDGFHFCRECKTDPQLKDIPFVFYTAHYTDNKDEAFAMALGADRFLEKPQDPEKLIAIFQEILAEPRYRGKLEETLLDRETYLSAHDERIVHKLEQKLAEMEDLNRTIRESEEKYRLLAENVQDVILVLDMNLRYSYASPSIVLLTGHQPAEILHKKPSDLLTPASWQLAKAVMLEEMAREKDGPVDLQRSRIVDLEMHRKDGATVWTEVKLSILRDEKHRPAGILSTGRDISERRKAEEALNKSFAQLRSALIDTVQAVAVTLETRDPYTAGHQRRVANLARAIATEMKLSRDQIEGLRMAATIHDLGKISVPAEILSKPTKLSQIEVKLIRTHPEAGYDILKNIHFPWPIARIVLEHHEMMDGSGYPGGLKGEERLPESRILSVADVVEAMASHRPYRPGLGIEIALAEIEKNRGTLYDARAVDACLKLFREKNFRL